MNNIYYIYAYIPEDIFNKRIKYLLSNQTNYDYRLKKDRKYVYGLYAWTTKKKLLKEFLNTRFKDAFIVKKSDDIDDLKYVKEKYWDLELEVNQFYFSFRYNPNNYNFNKNITISDKKSIKNDVVTTRQELIESTQYLSENMIKFFESNIVLDYRIFRKDIIEALDVLNYTTIYDMKCDTTPEDDESRKRYIKAENKMLSDKTVYGNNIIKYNENEYLGLMYLYSYLFFGV